MGIVCTINHIMKLESNGILISLRPFNERDSLAHIFTRDFGVLVGMMRGAAMARKNRPLVGQVGATIWGARLDSQLGVFHWDAARNMAVPIMMDSAGLGFMNSAFALLVALLPEREAYAALYDETIQMLADLARGQGKEAYLVWEVNLLRELGYALDLSRCSGCGGDVGLNYLSPRTGRAVCDVCAAPYVNKLYSLPLNLNTTLRFLESVCAQQGAEIPVMRKMITGI